MTPNKNHINKTQEQEPLELFPPPPPSGGSAPHKEATRRGRSETKAKSLPADPRVKQLLERINKIAPIGAKQWGRTTLEARQLLAHELAPTVDELFAAYEQWLENRDVARFGCSLGAFQKVAGVLLLRLRGLQPDPTRPFDIQGEYEREVAAIRMGRGEDQDDEE